MRGVSNKHCLLTFSFLADPCHTSHFACMTPSGHVSVYVCNHLSFLVHVFVASQVVANCCGAGVYWAHRDLRDPKMCIAGGP